MPILWVAYGTKCGLRSLVYAVEVLGLRDVGRLSEHLRRPAEKVCADIDTCLGKGYFPMMIREGDRLTEARAAEKPEDILHDVVCPCCSAHFTYRGTRGVCPYCGVAYSEKK